MFLDTETEVSSCGEVSVHQRPSEVHDWSSRGIMVGYGGRDVYDEWLDQTSRAGPMKVDDPSKDR